VEFIEKDGTKRYERIMKWIYVNIGKK
jgi:hypothetical protein